MARHVFLVFTNAKEGRSEEFNDWYTHTHLRDVLKIDGFVAAQRFELAEEGKSTPYRYLAIYELETDDLAGTLARLRAASGTPSMVLSDALDPRSVGAWAFSPITERIAP